MVFKLLVIECSEPPSPSNGLISNMMVDRWLYEQSVVYSCSSGYKLKGAATITCLETGAWSDGAPSCEGTCSFVKTLTS